MCIKIVISYKKDITSKKKQDIVMLLNDENAVWKLWKSV